MKIRSERREKETVWVELRPSFCGMEPGEEGSTVCDSRLEGRGLVCASSIKFWIEPAGTDIFTGGLGGREMEWNQQTNCKKHPKDITPAGKTLFIEDWGKQDQ